MAERHRQRHASLRAARDRAADELRHHARGADPLITRLALPARIGLPLGGLPRGPVVVLGGVTMGTNWSVRYVAEDDAPQSAIVERAITARLSALVDALSHWEPASAVGRFNRARPGTWVSLPADLAAVLGPALTLAELSGGAFDPGIGMLVDLWGFGPPGRCPAPTDNELERVLASGGAAALDYDPAESRLRQAGNVALDLSGIAKGYAVEALGHVLGAHHLRHWLVEIGGELAGVGLRPDGDPWWVDLEGPPGISATPLRVALHGLAVATSGAYVKGSHTLDPRTGRPATSGVRAASVLHESAMLADGWATIVSVLPPDEGLALAASHGIAARLLLDDTERAADERLTPALAAMLAD